MLKITPPGPGETVVSFDCVATHDFHLKSSGYFARAMQDLLVGHRVVAWVRNEFGQRGDATSILHMAALGIAKGSHYSVFFQVPEQEKEIVRQKIAQYFQPISGDSFTVSADGR